MKTNRTKAQNAARLYATLRYTEMRYESTERKLHALIDAMTHEEMAEYIRLSSEQDARREQKEAA